MKKHSAFREDLRRGLCSPVPWLALLLPLAIGIYSILLETRAALSDGRMVADTTSAWEFILILDFTSVQFMFPLLCLLPLAVSFSDELQFGYTRFYATRVGVKRYLGSRILSVALSGGLMLFAFEAICALYCLIIFKPFLAENTLATPIYQWNLAFLFPKTGPVLGYAYMAYRVLLAFCFGATWSVVGLALSAVYPNRYVTLAGPFLIYFGLFFTGDMLNFRWIDPSELVHPRVLFSQMPILPALLVMTIAYVVVFSASALLFYSKAKRRLIDG